MRTISLYDTRTGALMALRPPGDRPLGIYACGPTVYARVHVGNARPFVVFSLLKRFLVHEGYEVTFVANITDVNDKIYTAAGAAKVPSAQLAAEMANAYVADTDLLGLGRPDHEPLASECMDEIVALIGRLIDGGHAYVADGDVYFAVRSYPAYGELSHRDLDAMDQGEGLEGAARKRDPLDFALWKAHKDGEDTAWDAPWGRGRPGWHIECSAMAESLLGLDFEIHGGGSDLTFPHHENEAAQTCAAHGTSLARLWVHNGMLRIPRPKIPSGRLFEDPVKMSKSEGNALLLHDVLAAYGRDTMIMYFLGGHYHQPVVYDEERLNEAAARVARIRDGARRLVPGDSPAWSAPLRERFFDALAKDFNTPRALAAVFDWVHEANRSAEQAGAAAGEADLREMLEVLALDGLLETGGAAPAEIIELGERREQARARREWAEADRLRDEIASLGWEVRDGPSGPELLPVA